MNQGYFFLFRYYRAGLFFLVALLASCATSEAPLTLSKEFATKSSDSRGRSERFKKANADQNRDGLLHIYREKRFTGSAGQTALQIDDKIVAVFKHGAATVPISSGKYSLAIRFQIDCDSIVAGLNCERNRFEHVGQETELKVLPGQEIILEILLIESEPYFIFSEGSFNDFLDRKHQEAELLVARVDKSILTPAAFTKSIIGPARASRDQLVVQIGRMIKEGNFAGSLALFERLNALPVPIDPAIDYYWGRALIETGEASKGVAKLRRFLNRVGESSPLYVPGTKLIAKVKEG